MGACRQQVSSSTPFIPRVDMAVILKYSDSGYARTEVSPARGERHEEKCTHIGYVWISACSVFEGLQIIYNPFPAEAREIEKERKREREIERER